MTRNEWLEEKANYYFKNKEFFPNLTDKDLDEVLKKEAQDEDSFFLTVSLKEKFDTLTLTIEVLREFLDTPMIITSGFRSMRKHLEIYKKKGIPENKIPMGSKHLSLEAFDFRVKDMDKARMLLKHLYTDDGTELRIPISGSVQYEFDKLMWFEDFSATPSWIHCQITPPTSKKRFFLP